VWIGPTDIESLTRKLNRVRDVVIMAMGGFFFDGRDASWIVDAGGFCSSETRSGKKNVVESLAA